MIQCKRVYQPATADDGYRVLVDYLWPRGIKKNALVMDEWAKAVAPHPALRRAFHQGELDFATFASAYRRQLSSAPQCWQPLLLRARTGKVTLLFAARDEKQNQARVLADFLREQPDLV